MIEVKYKFISRMLIIIFAFVPIIGLFKAFFDIYKLGMEGESLKLILLCVFLLVILWTVFFSFIPNFKLIFDERGIIMKRKVKLFSMTLFDKIIIFPWNSINDLDVDSVRGLTFYKSENGSLRMVSLNFFLTNKKEAFEFAVMKLPSYKISKEARLKLKKKYGIIVE